MANTETMRQETKNQYGHFWRTYRSICGSFDRDSWTKLGFNLTQPDRLALHILQSTFFYIKGRVPLICSDGTRIEGPSAELPKDALPDSEEILHLLEGVEQECGRWLDTLDFDAPNEKFPWAGGSAAGVALFLLRHNQHHLGEMNGLLNERQKGAAADHFADSL